MANNPVNLYKQIIMHILHKVSLSLPQSVIIDTITDLGYTDYIQAQSAIGELVESGLASEQTTYHRTYISLTESGEETRQLFENELSPDIRREINEYLKSKRIETRDVTALFSDYQKSSDGMYHATCSVRDGAQTLFEVTLAVYTEDDALRICNAWESRSQELYSEALKLLMGVDTTDNQSEK